MIEPPLPCPARDRLEAAITFSSKRVIRAAEKEAQAAQEHVAAIAQFDDDVRALREWQLANPPEQPDLLEGADA